MEKGRENILIIRFSALGDVAMAVPVVYSLAMQYPDVRITVLSRGFARPLFEELAPNVRFMEADLKKEYCGVRGLNSLYRRLVAKNFTAIADFHDVLRSEYLRLRFNLSRYRVEHIDKHRNEKRKLISSGKKKLFPLPTSFQNYADVLARLGYPIKLSFKSIFPEGHGNLSLLPAEIGQKVENEIWIGIAPFAAHGGKVYPQEMMREVIGILSSENPQPRIFLFGRGKQEEEAFGRWCEEFGNCVNVGNCLKGMRHELILMSHLDVMVSMDSANMHLASVTGTPVISIWGATHPYAGFMGWNQSMENVIQLDMSCRPCSIYGNKPCRKGDFACMRNIKPEQIINKIKLVTSRK
ncbi:glycosyltransferase family 9 protein [Xylanibacter muris]|uniref:Glycosyltransferase family 9 protein n=1 Tax=Xylanibacter muris TaxID=2736290 RepID=A0ABX2AIU2_9BACT|nr:glycosyltransferase family 9 protein [Xylanibacter muris]NPD90991.1 glycosyltransferase family 9 protein [Xylanibacter muris]